MSSAIKKLTIQINIFDMDSFQAQSYNLVRYIYLVTALIPNLFYLATCFRQGSVFSTSPLWKAIVPRGSQAHAEATFRQCSLGSGNVGQCSRDFKVNTVGHMSPM